jgi:hypothetical protein
MLIVSLALQACIYAPSDQANRPAALPTTIDSQAQGSPIIPPRSDLQAKACPIPPGSPGLPALEEARTWITEISAYLNSGGLLTALIESLGQRTWVQGYPSAGEIADFDLDGTQDLAVTVLEAAPDGSVSGSLLIFICQQDRFELSYLSSPAIPLSLPEMAAVEDFNADASPDVLLALHQCGAHTCFISLQLLSWGRTQFADILSGRSDDLPNPTLVIDGPLPDGSLGISLTGTGISSAGAGPYRERTRVWSWVASEGRFVPAPDILQAPRYRIHMLHDADLALAQGDFSGAEAGYGRVIEDGTLDDWIGGESSRRALAAFAAFRQLWLHLLLHETGQASAVLEFMRASATNDSADLLEMARITFETYQLEGIDAACGAAQAFAGAHQQGVLEPLNFGYANRTYNLPDLCLVPE